MVQISWLWGLDKINPERVGAANDGGKSRGQPVNIGDFSALFRPGKGAGGPCRARLAACCQKP
jgi:hypothetical protein